MIWIVVTSSSGVRNSKIRTCKSRSGCRSASRSRFASSRRNISSSTCILCLASWVSLTEDGDQSLSATALARGQSLKYFEVNKEFP